MLEGWDALSFDFLLEVMNSDNIEAASHALLLSKRFIKEENIDKAVRVFKSILKKNEIGLDVYLGSTIGSWLALNEEIFTPIMMEILKRRKLNSTITESVISGLTGVDSLISSNKAIMDTLKHTEFVNKLVRSLSDKKNEKLNSIYTRKSINEDNRTSGAKMFYQICASCHGSNGKGIDGLAPPLMGSEHVKNTERLALIILHGLEGSVHVNGEEYNINLAMPGLIRNETITDKDIADIISYVTNAFSDVPKTLLKQRINELRSVNSNSGMEFTEVELKALDK